jgi:N-acetyl-anhydromuramyl-L-alanine amidase AmpD
MTPIIPSSAAAMALRSVADERRHSRVLQQPLAAPRGGIMLHYDDSTRDDWAVEWFQDPRCTNGYTWLVLDDGRVIELADPAYRTPHAGPCLTPRANSAFYGIAAATNGLVPATDAQLDAIARLCAAVARFEGWSDESLVRRIVGHDAEAVWTPAYTPNRARWGKVGRKIDPTGIRADGRPIVDMADLRRRIGVHLG